MYTSVRITQAKPGSVDKIGQLVTNDFVPIVSALPGFIGYYVISIGGDRLMTISIFEDEKGALASIQASYDWVSQNITEWLARPLDFMEGQVIAHKTR